MSSTYVTPSSSSHSMPLSAAQPDNCPCETRTCFPLGHFLHAAGGAPWFLTLFLVPFVLVGLGMLGAIGYFFLALFNPRPTLRVSSSAVPLGGAVELRWELDGQVHRVRRLEVALEGREEAQYQRGTSTVTDREDFARLPIAAVTDPLGMARGETAFTIPTDTMHSFASENNKIVWHLCVHGDIRMWPDVKEEFAFTVLPASSAEERSA